MKTKMILLCLVASAVLVVCGAMIGMMLTANSFYYIYGVNQTPYDVADRYEACIASVAPNEDCLLIPMKVELAP